MRARRGWAGVAGVAVLGASARAWALCPNCLGQSAAFTTTLRLVGIFLLIPPAVFFTVALWIRRIHRR